MTAECPPGTERITFAARAERYARAVVDGEIVAGKLVSITFTFDHRHADGAHGAPFFRRFQKIFESPERFPHVFEARPPSAD